MIYHSYLVSQKETQETRYETPRLSNDNNDGGNAFIVFGMLLVDGERNQFAIQGHD
jgi:hypothetical protein